MKRLLCLLSVAVLALTVPAYADTVTFDNGDRLTGRVIGEEDGKVILDVPGIGELRVDADRIILRDTGEPLPAEDLATTVEVLAEEIEKEEKSPWEAHIDLGATYATGNTERVGLTFNFVVKRITEANEFTARFWALYTEADKERTENEQILAFRYDWKFDNWYTFAGVNFERDEFEDLDLRAQFLGGVGTWLDKSENSTIKVETAPAATYVDYISRDDEWLLEWVFAFWGEWKVLDQLTIKQFIRWIPDLTNTPEWRANWITDFETPLSEKLFGKLSFILDYNTNVPEGIERTDIKVVLSLVYRF